MKTKLTSSTPEGKRNTIKNSRACIFPVVWPGEKFWCVLVLVPPFVASMWEKGRAANHRSGVDKLSFP